MGYETTIASAISTGRGIDPITLCEGALIDVSYRSLRSLPDGARTAMKDFEMISEKTLNTIESDGDKGGIAYITITKSFLNKYRNSRD